MTVKFGVFVPQGWRMDLVEIKDPVPLLANGSGIYFVESRHLKKLNFPRFQTMTY